MKPSGPQSPRPPRPTGSMHPAAKSSAGLQKTGSLYALDATVPRYPRRFRWRVIRYILSISLLASAVAFGYTYFRQSEFMRQDRHARGRTLSQTMAEGASLGAMSNQPALLAGAIDRLFRSSDVELVEVYRVDGSRLTRRTRQGVGDSKAPAKSTVRQLLAARLPLSIAVDGPDRDDYYSPILVSKGDAVLAAYGAEKPPPVEYQVVGYVRVAVSHAHAVKRRDQLLMWSIYLAGGLLLLGLVLAILVGWRLSAPILKLAAGADAIRHGSLDVQVDIRSHDELGQLADSFNRMVWKLKDTVEKLADLNRNLEFEVKDRTRDIQGMADFIRILNARRDLQALVNDAIKALMEATSCRVGAIFLYNEQAATLSLQSCEGVGSESFGAAIVKLGEGPVGTAAQQSEPVVLTDEQGTARLSSAVGTRLEAVIYQRIRFAEALAGVLVLGSEKGVTERQREMVDQALNPLAIAVANAKAFGAAERLARELETRNIELTKQTELLAEQKRQLEEMNRLKSELMANITHELRTPLNAVIGYAELMVAGAYGDVNEEQSENLQAIVDSARGLLNLITQILDMAKMEAGQMGLVLSGVDICAVLREAAQTAQVLARDKPVKIGLGLPKGELVQRTDDGKLRQIVNNLVSNAVKFTEEGRVELLAVKRADGSLHILVRDTGIGIDPKQQTIIFDEFRQADGSTTRDAMGTGLGLAISLKFARLLGGDITLDSALGKGSTFTVLVPAEPPTETAVEARDEARRLDDVSQALGFSSGKGASQLPPRRPGTSREQVDGSEGMGEISLSLLDDGLTDDS
ncbi:MAG: ATP-binding protein [bacterium]